MVRVNMVLNYFSHNMKKSVFGVNINSKDRDQPAEIHSLIRNLAILSYFYIGESSKIKKILKYRFQNPEKSNLPIFHIDTANPRILKSGIILKTITLIFYSTQ